MAKTSITRSFGYKLNVGNYESRDFFCCQQMECEEEEADVVSDRLYAFCAQQVLNDVKQYKKLRDATRGVP